MDANRVVSALVVVPTGVVAAELAGGALPGLLAAALVAVHPLLARLGASEDPFAFYALTLLTAVAVGRRALRRERPRLFAVGAVLASVAAFARDSTVVAGPVFAVLVLQQLPTRRRWLYVVLGLAPFVAGAARVLTFERLGPGDGLVTGPGGLQRLASIAHWATRGGLQVMRTPALFPALAVLGLGVLLWRRPSAALRLAVALGLLQGPFAVVLGTASSPYSPARHLSAAVVLWTVPAAALLAGLVDLAARPFPRVTGPWRAGAAVALMLVALADAAAMLPRATPVEREYVVMRECLRRLPAEARVQPLAEPRTSHVAAQSAWLRSERPAWKPRSAGVDFDDRWEGRAVPTVLLVDHGCSADLTLDIAPDFSRATEPTPWGPMTPACAAAFRARPWQAVLRVDLALDEPRPGQRAQVPVGCLVDAPVSER